MNWYGRAVAVAARIVVVLFAALIWVSPAGAVSGQPVVTTVHGFQVPGGPNYVHPGNYVSITGTGFTGATSVEFGGVSAPAFSFNSDVSISVQSPFGTLGTSVDVTVTTPDGTSATGPGTLVTYGNTNQPGVDSLTPSSGPEAGGTPVTISGSAFNGAVQVYFGGTANLDGTPATSFAVVNDTTISAIAPAGVGIADIFVENVIGTGNCVCVDPAPIFTYIPAPVVTKLVRNGGNIAGGDTVILTGTGFTGATAVAFGGTPATGFTVNSNTQITATTPAGTGTVNVTVTTPGGTSATGAGNLFYYGAPQPVITSMGPDKGAEAGGTGVVMYGSGFTGASQVRFGSTPATFSVQSDSEIWVTSSPPGTGAVDVIVEAPGGDSAPGTTFTYYPVPGTASLSPNSGPEAGGTAVTLTGSGFAGDFVFVWFGSQPAQDITINSDTSLTVISLPGTGTVDVTVETRGGTSPALPFTYLPPGPPQDSINAGLVQEQLTPVVASTSGHAFADAIAKGIAQGFSGGFAGDFGFASESAFLAYSPSLGGADPFADIIGGPGQVPDPALLWNAWLDVQGSGLLGDDDGGGQVNVIGGLGYRFSKGLVVGLVGGHESFSYTSTAPDGTLSGSGLSAGAYAGWRFARNGTFDAALIWTGLGYDVASGLASGHFDASRWLLTSGLTGDFELTENLTVSPSARVYALWESQMGWTDSLATAHAARSFSNGTASAGTTFSGRWLLLDDMTVRPYFGGFADVTFDTDGSLATSGLAGRVTGGFALDLSAGTAISIGGKLSGLGSAQRSWSLNAGIKGTF